MKCTMKDVADKLGISITTVSHAINGTRHVSPKTKDAVMAAVKELGYTPNSLAQGLKTRKTKSIGIIVPDIASSFFPTFVQVCESEAYKAGYNTILCNSNDNVEREHIYLELLRSKQISGLLIAPTGDNTSYLYDFISDDIPIVFFDRYLPKLSIDYIGFDNSDSAYRITEEFIKRGYKKIAFVTSGLWHSSSLERFSGYKTCLNDNNIDFNQNLVFETKNLYSDTNMDKLNADFRKAFIKAAPEAAIVTNTIALQCLLVLLNELNPHWYKSFGIIGFFTSPLLNCMSPTLSVVNLPTEKMAKQAFQILLDRINNPVDSLLRYNHIELKSELIIRDT